MARFKLDENLPSDAAVELRAAGHDAVTVAEQGMSGELDPAVAAVYRVEARTLDTDFADRRIYRPDEHAGIVVLRLRRQDRTTSWRRSGVCCRGSGPSRWRARSGS